MFAGISPHLFVRGLRAAKRRPQLAACVASQTMRATTTKIRVAAHEFGILALLGCFFGLFLLQLAVGIERYTQAAASDVATVKEYVLAAVKGVDCEWHNATSVMGPFHLRELCVRAMQVSCFV